uniref:Uncharacterized protein n=1 Tax=Moniliophthora roreri TaxID=221103 RepID=A0A0W0EX92_MONRR
MVASSSSISQTRTAFKRRIIYSHGSGNVELSSGGRAPIWGTSTINAVKR